MEKAQRMTRQKRVILEVLRGTKSHPTADWIYEQAKKMIPDLSLGTVYRNLNLLKEMGEIMELNYGSTFSRFDGNPHNHYHFQCRQCGRVFDLDLPIQNKLEKETAEVSGHRIDNHRLEFYGVCRECQASEPKN
ncbi:MAG: ferric uptake regulator, Fur family [Peptococcaceae bacterium]|nr:transcriptional repressor [Thermanaerosceptrum fracticalcis]MBZ4653362.1 ferric uptake regulator, Fur family [Peptococcaceae bacterium]